MGATCPFLFHPILTSLITPRPKISHNLRLTTDKAPVVRTLGWIPQNLLPVFLVSSAWVIPQDHGRQEHGALSGGDR